MRGYERYLERILDIQQPVEIKGVINFNPVDSDLFQTFRNQLCDARRVGELTLAELLRHPERITDQLVTLRAVQTLALIDVLNYREHIFNLGRYEDSQDDPGDLLTLPIDGESGA